jgi:hypothetical protein
MNFPNNTFDLTRKIDFNNFVVGQRYYFVLKENLEQTNYKHRNFFGTYTSNLTIRETDNDDEDDDEDDDDDIFFYVLFNNVSVTKSQDEAINVENNNLQLMEIFDNDNQIVVIQENQYIQPNRRFIFNFELFDFYLVNQIEIEGGKRKRTRRRIRTRRRRTRSRR